MTRPLESHLSSARAWARIPRPPGRAGWCAAPRWRGSGGWRGAVHLLADDRGAATAEYAIATMAAVGFAGLLVVILRSEEVRAMLTDVVRHALSIP